MNVRTTVLLCGCVSLAASPGWSAITIDGFMDATNDRFTNSPAFILDGFDLSGIGQNDGAGWSTAISRNVVISAAHAPSNGSISFFANNDPASAAVTRTVSSGTKIGSTDLYLAVLNEALPDSIKHYTFASEALNAGLPSAAPFPVGNAGIYQGMNAYLFGLSSTGGHSANRTQAVGRNLVSGYSENVPFLGNLDNDSILFAYDTLGSPNYTNFEARFVGGDSGGPTFVDVAGELRLLGTNAFIYEMGDFSIGGRGSGINYTGNQAAFIQNFIAINAVPEPSSAVLLSWTTLCILFRRNRHRVPAWDQVGIRA